MALNHNFTDTLNDIVPQFLIVLAKFVKSGLPGWGSSN